jgi:hypothetical protein
MKYFSICLALSLQLSCTNSKKVRLNEDVQFSEEVLVKNISTDSGVVISCFRCSCIDNLMAEYVTQGVTIPVYADTNCFQLRPIHFFCLSQKLIDSLSQRNYNAILFKKTLDSKYKFEILKTDDSKKFGKIIRNFFTSKE